MKIRRYMVSKDGVEWESVWFGDDVNEKSLGLIVCGGIEYVVVDDSGKNVEVEYGYEENGVSKWYDSGSDRNVVKVEIFDGGDVVSVRGFESYEEFNEWMESLSVGSELRIWRKEEKEWMWLDDVVRREDGWKSNSLDE